VSDDEKHDLSAAGDMNKRFGDLFEPAEPPAWCGIRIDFLDTTDWDTVWTYALERLQPCTLRFKERGKAPIDVKIIGQAEIEVDGENVGGIYVAPWDEENSETILTQQYFVRYENIESFGVY
jgi:hypothetical protein